MTTTQTQETTSKKSPKTKTKKSKANSVKAKPGRKPNVPDDARITVLTKENPRRQGSKAHKRFSLLKTGMTVGQYLKKGGSRGSLRSSLRRKYIKVSKKS